MHEWVGVCLSPSLLFKSVRRNFYFLSLEVCRFRFLVSEIAACVCPSTTPFCNGPAICFCKGVMEAIKMIAQQSQTFCWFFLNNISVAQCICSTWYDYHNIICKYTHMSLNTYNFTTQYRLSVLYVFLVSKVKTRFLRDLKLLQITECCPLPRWEIFSWAGITYPLLPDLWLWRPGGLNCMEV